jgi:hypothetical protein
MAKKIPEKVLIAIQEAVGLRPQGADLPEIANALNPPVPKRTLQYRLKYLVDARKTREGGGRSLGEVAPAGGGGGAGKSGHV